ncbi:MAG: FixH family protein [Thiohalobacteraceae bacterium]
MQALLSLPVGIVAQLLLFLLLHRVVRMAVKPAALIVALASVALYVPYAILIWPGADVLALHLAVYLLVAYALGLVMGQRAAGEKAGFHWAPTIIIAFFVVLVLFNGVLVVVSTQGLPEPLARVLLPPPMAQRGVSSAFPGVVQHDFQKKEALYNAYLEQVERQQARGWKVHKGWLGEARAGHPSLFQVIVTDRDDRPIAAAEVSGTFLRPADTRLDQPFVLTEVAPGQYRGEFTLPVPGIWQLVLEIQRGADLHEVRGTTSIAD